jgi:hypothetical protein
MGIQTQKSRKSHRIMVVFTYFGLFLIHFELIDFGMWKRMDNTFLILEILMYLFHNILQSSKGVIFFNNGFNNDPTKFVLSTILVTIG